MMEIKKEEEMMKKKLNQFLAVAVAAMMVTGMAACGSQPAATETKADNASEAQQPESTPAKEEAAAGDDTPLVVGSLAFSEKFSPFFAESAYDQDVVSVVCPVIVKADRTGAVVQNAIEGETIGYNGTDYDYKGFADVSVEKGEDTTTYTLKLKEGLVFEDGEPITADDLIFTFYVFSDPDYDGFNTFNAQPVVGLKNYMANSTAADSVTAEDVSKVLAEMPEGLASQIVENIIAPILAGEQAFCEENYEAMSYETPEAFYVDAYSLDETYSAEGKDFAAIVSDVTAQYGTDYKTLATNYAGDDTYFDEDVNKLAESYIVEQKKEAGEGEEVPNIEGIKKVDDLTISITTNGYDATTIYQLGVNVGALHYYGDAAAYDYDNNQFGFTRGDLSSIREKTNKPLGYGPYKFQKYENKIVYFEGNDKYMDGAPKIKYMQWKESTDADKIPGVEQGTVDITDPSGSKTAFENIGKINGNGELNGDKINTSLVDNLGYGYIGISAKTVNVGGEPGSVESKNLRKAIATVISAYRDVSIDSYYGDAASVINYPISNTSWAAPQKADPGYEVAFSKDVDGNPIYTEGMSDEEKYDAALQAALGYFEAAGYTVADGKLTAAPAGAKLEYEVMIPADGNGDHPSFAILTDAKAALEKIGFTLDVNDLSDSNILWDKLNAKTAELWCAAWQATVDPDMYQIYHSESESSNHYCIADPDLDEMIMEARQSDDKNYRKSIYKECLDTILDWAVEIPVYQRQNCVIYSTERVNADTFTPDVTTFYKWIEEVQNVELVK